MRRLALPTVVAICALLLVPAAGATPKTKLTEERATAIFVANPKVASWLRNYPEKSLTKETTYSQQYGNWTIKVWTSVDSVGEVATGRVEDATGKVIEAWTGPQVAWKMARGSPGAFGGKQINSLPIWLGLCAAFLFGLADFRRPLSVRNLDLIALLSFSVSLWYFNKGHVFTAMPIVYPALFYLLGRMIWSGLRSRAPTESRPVWPVWLLAGATVFLVGFRIGLNVKHSNVIDVGYSGVIGGERITTGQSPYGHFPVENGLKACGPADQDGEIRDHIQTNGRCESANPLGDTYGPVAYEAYVPAYLAFGWSGRWDTLPAAHAASITFDILCLIGLALVGLRLGGPRLGVTLAFAWAAWPFTQYVSNSNTNDALPPLFLIWGFLFVTSAFARGFFSALSGWTKFAPLLVAPLWASYPDAFARPRQKLVFVGGFVVATLVAFSILLLDPNPIHAVHVFYDRTIQFQIGRHSPFSIWDWKQYRAGYPDLHILQRVLQVLLVIGAVAVYFVPRRKTWRQLAALTAALLIGFELVLTHWFYLYLPWFFPFVALVVLSAERAPVSAEVPEPVERKPRALVAAG
ncbi:MAG TPA: hypothetical protein VF063_03875 [Gaiellaceae bacterium]